MSKARTFVIFVDLILAGIWTGLFFTYSFTIMPGLATTDDQTFVAAFQGLERMFTGIAYGINWPVFIGFVGVPIFTIAAIVQNRNRPLVWWLVAALALSAIAILSSFIFNLPLNTALNTAGDPTLIDVTQVRADFQEYSWRAWNHVRSFITLGVFGCLCWTLFLHGAQTPSERSVIT